MIFTGSSLRFLEHGSHSSISVRSPTIASGWLRRLARGGFAWWELCRDQLVPADFCRADSRFIPAILQLEKLFIITQEQTNNPSLRNFRQRASRLRC